MLQPSTLKFLKDLKKNNDRGWFQKNKNAYESAKKDFEDFLQKLIPAIAKFDPSVNGLQPKDCIFRIYRDVRFSKNKAPYKNHFGAYIAAGGRKSMKPGYYFHIEPKNSIAAGGAYMPPPAELKAIRQEIDYNFDAFKKLITKKDFVKYFGTMQGEKVKTTPKGYDKTNPAIEFLKHKDFLAVHSVADEKLVQKNAVTYMANAYQKMHDFNKFLAVCYE